eukprot:TRINITY_DN2500_c0_g1_i3.p1 TRINITY_DN2500_c0_g1~~TRINITY_DN2500_c0_g1_i3.p1  ORF type:complete len:748 (-),score=93.08 TRINITY_DN2500_c0_g1_i3:253-2436(-)
MVLRLASCAVLLLAQACIVMADGGHSSFTGFFDALSGGSPPSLYAFGWSPWFQRFVQPILGLSILALVIAIGVLACICPCGSRRMEKREPTMSAVCVPFVCLGVVLIALPFHSMQMFADNAQAVAVEMRAMNKDVVALLDSVQAVNDSATAMREQSTNVFDSCEGVGFLAMSILRSIGGDAMEAIERTVVNGTRDLAIQLQTHATTIAMFGDPVQVALKHSDSELSKMEEWVRSLVYASAACSACMGLLVIYVVVAERFDWMCHFNRCGLFAFSSVFWIILCIFLVLALAWLTAGMTANAFCDRVDDNVADVINKSMVQVMPEILRNSTYCSVKEETKKVSGSASVYVCEAMVSQSPDCSPVFYAGAPGACTCVLRGHVCNNRTSSKGNNLYLARENVTSPRAAICEEASTVSLLGEDLGSFCDNLMDLGRMEYPQADLIRYLTTGEGVNPVDGLLQAADVDVLTLLQLVTLTHQTLESPWNIMEKMCPAFGAMQVGPTLNHIHDILDGARTLLSSQQFQGSYGAVVHDSLCGTLLDAFGWTALLHGFASFLLLPILVLEVHIYVSRKQHSRRTQAIAEHDALQRQKELARKFRALVDEGNYKEAALVASDMQPTTANHVYEDGETPLTSLLLTPRDADEGVIAALLSAKADPSTEGRDKLAPIVMASRSGQMGAVELLEQVGGQKASYDDKLRGHAFACHGKFLSVFGCGTRPAHQPKEETRTLLP